MKKSKKRGRPVGYRVEEPANKNLTGVRLTETQLNAYKQAAKKTNMSFSAWVRQWLDKGLHETDKKQ